MENISVLFVREDSIYKNLGLDCWDINRNALLWPGGNPIIAHPPCRAWGRLRSFAKPRPGEKECAIWAIDQIRKYGGVLEHPSYSSLWKYLNLPIPGSESDNYGGYSISLNQHWFGHKAEKNTWLYIVGLEKKRLPPYSPGFNAVEWWVTTSSKSRRKTPQYKAISKKERESTPIEFAKFLIEIARNCKI